MTEKKTEREREKKGKKKKQSEGEKIVHPYNTVFHVYFFFFYLLETKSRFALILPH